MFRPQIQKTRVLFFIALFNLILVYISTNSYQYYPKEGLNKKIKATKIMSECINSIKNTKSKIHKEDLYNTGLLGVRSSPITTIFDDGSKNIKDSKIACTHPNFAALVVEMFQEIELKENDSIALSMTGSLPGANIAVLSACKAMNLNPTIISSIGSSAWGANEKDFTWLDIESLLNEKNIIEFKSIATSIGGTNDLGDNLSDNGIEIIENVISSKNLEFINDKNLSKNIERKISVFNNNIENYKAYINVGGGAASLGYGEGKDSMKVGVIYPIEKEDISFSGFENSIAKYFLDNDITLINIKSINLLAGNVGLYPPSKDIALNEGALFYTKGKYNLLTIIVSIFLSVLSVSSVGIYSHIQIKKRMREYEPDSVI